jgi:flagellin FlaB
MREERAQVGIGTLIIFIAMILVAAIAAAVLINTASSLQQKAQATGKEAIAEVASNIQVESVVGNRSSATDTTLDYLFLKVSLAPGSEPVDLSQVVIPISDGQTTQDLTWDSANATSTTFTASEIRDVDNSFTTSTPVLTSGDLIQIEINATAVGLSLDPRTEVSVTLSPETGAPAIVEFTTPNSYGTDLYIELYP